MGSSHTSEVMNSLAEFNTMVSDPARNALVDAIFVLASAVTLLAHAVADKLSGVKHIRGHRPLPACLSLPYMLDESYRRAIEGTENTEVKELLQEAFQASKRRRDVLAVEKLLELVE